MAIYESRDRACTFGKFLESTLQPSFGTERKPAASSKGPWKYRRTISSVIWVTFGNLDARLCCMDKFIGNEDSAKPKIEDRTQILGAIFNVFFFFWKQTAISALPKIMWVYSPDFLRGLSILTWQG
jgi:hypothetical protein